MEVRDILQKKGSKVWSIKATQTLHEALQILVDQNIGALLVFDQKNNIAGILSERDIVHECHQSAKNLDTTPVSKVMTTNIIIGAPEDKVEYIMGIMTNNRIRHVPIVSGGKLQGIISIGDVVKAQLQNSEYEIRYLKDYMFGGR
ncbi:MAG: CBS domain-containing protein [Candidatus Omnitrophica bacterium]|nr:CBS domain-containing protein [Candidatus Omnitrophota bacterium]